jgi:hypothetical protein
MVRLVDTLSNSELGRKMVLATSWLRCVDVMRMLLAEMKTFAFRTFWGLAAFMVNPLKFNGYCKCHEHSHFQILLSDHTVYAFVACECENKWRYSLTCGVGNEKIGCLLCGSK